jgi:hypothetical protein
MHTGKGLTIDDIAEQENVSPVTVQDSIDIMREYRFRNSNDNVALAINETVLSHITGISRTFKRGLAAIKYIPGGVTRGGKTKYVKVDDTAMQLKTVASIRGLQEIAQPKAPLIQNNTQFNNNPGGPGMGFAPGMSFESRLRKIREQRGLTNDEETGVESAADADVDQTLQDELADQGIEIDETEEGELVEEE